MTNIIIDEVSVNPDDLESHSMEELVKVHNALNREGRVKRFDSKSVAVERVKALLVRAMRERVRAEGRTRRSRIAKDRVIGLLVETNPKRAGTKSFQRFSKYRGGMTVGEALEAGIQREDIRYDIDHGNIIVI